MNKEVVDTWCRLILNQSDSSLSRIKEEISACTGNIIDVSFDNAFFGNSSMLTGNGRIKIDLNVDHVSSVALMGEMCHSSLIISRDQHGIATDILTGYYFYAANRSGLRAGRDLHEVGVHVENVSQMLDFILNIGIFEMVSSTVAYHEFAHILYENPGCNSCKYCTAARLVREVVDFIDINEHLISYEQLKKLYFKNIGDHALNFASTERATDSSFNAKDFVEQIISDAIKGFDYFTQHYTEEDYERYRTSFREEIFCDLMAVIVSLWETDREYMEEAAVGLDQILALNLLYRRYSAQATLLDDYFVHKFDLFSLPVHIARVNAYIKCKAALSKLKPDILPSFPESGIKEFLNGRHAILFHLIEESSRRMYEALLRAERG